MRWFFLTVWRFMSIRLLEPMQQLLSDYKCFLPGDYRVWWHQAGNIRNDWKRGLCYEDNTHSLFKYLDVGAFSFMKENPLLTASILLKLLKERCILKYILTWVKCKHMGTLKKTLKWYTPDTSSPSSKVTQESL